MRKLLCLTAFLWAHAALAGAPPEMHPHVRATQPYAEATYTALWMDIYHISLWTDAPEWTPNRAFAQSITYHMAFTSQELVGRTCEELKRHTQEAAALCGKWKAKLTAGMPNVYKGDRITAVRTANGALQFYYNGTLTSVIESSAFATHFFNIWLGKNTSEPALRDTLLKRS